MPITLKPEQSVQVSVVEWIETCAPQVFVFSIKNEARVTPAHGDILNRMGRKKGMPDLGVLAPVEPPRCFFIECKPPGGEPRDDQQIRAMQIALRGFKVWYATSIDDVREIFRVEGIPTREAARAVA